MLERAASKRQRAGALHALADACGGWHVRPHLGERGMMKIERGTGMGGMPKSGGDFVPEDTVGELLTPPGCPEFSTHAARGGEGKGQLETAIKGGIKRKRKNRKPNLRGPKPRFTKELFERVWRRVARGEGVGTSVRAEGMGTSRFYECMAARPYWAVALQRAREHKPPAHVSRRAVGRRAGGRERKARFTMDMHEDDLSQLSDRMLILLLKAAAPEKYGVASPKGKAGSGKRMGRSNQFATFSRPGFGGEGRRIPVSFRVSPSRSACL